MLFTESVQEADACITEKKRSTELAPSFFGYLIVKQQNLISASAENIQ